MREESVHLIPRSSMCWIGSLRTTISSTRAWLRGLASS